MILITGASGTVGTALTSALSAMDHPFRAAFHSIEKAERAAAKGYDTVQIDFAKTATLPPALEGIEAVFLLGTGVREQAECETNVIRAAGNAGVKRLVKLSVWGAADEQFELARMHRSIERAIEASGLAWTFLRPNGFMQNFSNHHSQTIKAKGAIYQPAGEASISFIDVRDIADAAAVALTKSGHENKAYELSGPQALTYGEVAGILSRVLGRDITYVPLSDADARAGMLQAGMPDFYADAMIDLMQAYRGGIASRVTPEIEDLTGHAPVAFERFIRDHTDHFR